MQVFIVYWHPEPQSFNYALVETTVSTLRTAGHTVQLSDLHEMQFNPVSGRHNFYTTHNPAYFKQQFEERYASENDGFTAEIRTEMEKIEACDLMIWQFPLWWFGLPAMLKGWVDRVFAMGRVYGGGKIYADGVFRGKKALLSLTTGGGPEAYLPGGFNGNIHSILRPIHRGMLQFVGFDVLAPHIVYGPARLSPEERRERLAAYAARLTQIESEPPTAVGIY
jgi:NAD(P)H dehydrogenase (quinone)